MLDVCTRILGQSVLVGTRSLIASKNLRVLLDWSSADRPRRAYAVVADALGPVNTKRFE